MAMNRNTEMKMSGLPTLQYGRSRHQYRKNHKTSMNTGELVPIYANELVQPGDTFKVSLSLVARMTTPYQPVMDNAYLDTWAFKIDWLDIWNKTKEFWGENTQGAWAQTTEYVVPKIKVTAGTKIENHTLLSYLWGIQGTYENDIELGGGLSVNAANFCYNEWFRDQNYIPPLELNMDGTTITYDANDTTKGGKLCKVAKLHDRFTSMLPAPLKGEAVGMPIGTTAPVIGNGNPIKIYGNSGSGEAEPGSIFTGGSSSVALYTNGSQGTQFLWRNLETGVDSGMVADLTAALTATLNAQRLAVTANQILEDMAIYGTRYREIIKGMWGVNSSDTAQHIPEYLGGKRTIINVEQVTQTSAEAGNLGDTGAMSITADYYEMFTKSFTEHSVILIFAAIRTDQTYGQGVSRQYFKERRLDYYWNRTAHIGFQPVYQGELFLQGGDEDRQAIGYLPAHQEYRSEVNMLTGMFNPNYSNSNGDKIWLKEWTYANNFENTPVMGQEFIEETTQNMDRTLTVQSSAGDQFICDFEFIIDKHSEVPLFGTPGLTKF